MTAPLLEPPRGRHALVTGGAGFLGSTLVDELVTTGWRVRVFDDLSTGRREHLAAALASGRVELVVGSVLDGAGCALALGGVTTVFHLACSNLRRSLHDPWHDHEVNARGTLTLLEACRARPAGRLERFVQVSSSEVYGTARDLRPMTEDHPCRPTTPYGASKLAGEALARSYATTFALPVVIVRPFNAYGPRAHADGDAGEVIPRFVTRALAGQPLEVSGDGRQERDFTHARDLARGLRLAAEQPLPRGETLHLGSGRAVSVAALAASIRRLCGHPDLPIRHLPVRPGDLDRLLADASHAARLLGWKPEIAWDDGLAEVVTWFAGSSKRSPAPPVAVPIP